MIRSSSIIAASPSPSRSRQSLRLAPRTCCRSTAKRNGTIRRSPLRARTGRRRRNACRRRARVCCPTSACPRARMRTTSARRRHRSARAGQPRFRLRRLDGVGVATALSVCEHGRVQPGGAAGRAGRFHARIGAPGPDPARGDRLFRRPARAVQRRARRKPEGRGIGAARAGEAELRGRRRDDHRHERSAGQVRLDRRAGDLRAQRPREQADGAARHHRPRSRRT